MPDKQEITRDSIGRWEKGQSGNPNGRPKKNLCIPDILKEIGRECDKDDISNLEMIMRVVFKKALNGEMKAIEYISERLEGKIAVKETMDWVRPISEINFEEL